MSYLQQLSAIIEELQFLPNEYTFLAEMADKTWFKVGGKADVLIHSANFSLIQKLLVRATKLNIPYFFLGDGSNIVISDAGIAGIVIDTKSFIQQPKLIAQSSESVQLIASAGMIIEELVVFAIEQQLEGVGHFYGLPGTLGGALFMNARCYEGEIADVFVQAKYLKNNQIITLTHHPQDWGYKRSPFQAQNILIVEATLSLKPSTQSSAALLAQAQHYKQDRESKGHFLYPCAGSTFKNNRQFGKPSGQIIDECKLKGFSYGGACVADFHGNIIINKNQATAKDIYTLTKQVQDQVFQQTGHLLEPEVLFIGRGYTQAL